MDQISLVLLSWRVRWGLSTHHQLLKDSRNALDGGGLEGEHGVIALGGVG